MTSLIRIFFLLSICINSYTYAQSVENNLKQLYTKRPLQFHQTNTLTLDSSTLIIEIEKNDITQLVKSGDVHILKHVEKNHYIIKYTGKIASKLFAKSTYIALANNEWKLSSKVLTSKKISNAKLRIEVVGLSKEELRHYLENNEFTDYKIIYHYSKTLAIQTNSITLVHLLKASDKVTHIDLMSDRVQEEAVISSHDLSFNKINKVHSDFPNLNGNGLTVSIKEEMYNNIDIDVIGRNTTSGIESSSVSSHATDMATIIGGAGNSFITGKGSAWGCNFTSSNFDNIFPDDDIIYKDLGVSVQNHSYGTTVVDNRYGVEAMLYDENTKTNPTLLHVFSAGNIGMKVASEGIYKDISHYANLSGNFKMAKNTLLVGSVDELGQVSERNSAGPTYDGRLKPELVAFGKNGTSESAALVSGVGLLLQQLYFEKKGVLPTSSFLKAVLIAGAEDIGDNGIDFKTGYGSINASRSVDIINSNNYYKNSISYAQEITFNITIPPNVNEAKIALTWNDLPANAEDIKALINDLDLKVTNALTNEVWLPWVLDHSANISSLSNSATRKEDHLNNVEFITINFPTSGIYSVSISGNSILSASQEFDVAYYWDFIDQFQWTYPSSKDIVIANDSTTLRWEGPISGISSIEIQTDGKTWTTALNNIDLAVGHITWKATSEPVTGKLRTLINGVYVESDTFTIAPLIPYKVGFNCDDEFMLYWENVVGVEGYRVYQLGNKYLELVSQTVDTMIIFPKNKFQKSFYSVSPIWSGNEGNTSLAYNYTYQGVNCYYRNFLATNEANQYIKIELNISTNYNVKEIVIEKKEENGNYLLVASLPLGGKQLQYIVEDRNPITNYSYYRAKIILHDNSEIILEEVKVFFPNQNTIEIFPNPISKYNFFTVHAKGDGRELVLMNIKGKKIYQWNIQTNISNYYLPNIQEGMYVLQIKSNDTVYGQKRIIVY
ncbi:MAG: S8 family peptidase [Cyclobacteriaceae bacterium]|nr:S8 family peptidase [Cyclobacteriaceae bacterium]